MPASMQLERDVVKIVLTGTTEPGEVLAALEQAAADPRSAGARGLLFDVRASESLLRRTPDEIRSAVRLLETRARGFGRGAIVATEGVRYGMMRMATTFTELTGGRARVFLSEEEALTWLAEDAAGSGEPPALTRPG